MAGIINWKRVSLPPTSPDVDHVYVGIDLADDFLYVKDSGGNVTKFATNAQVSASISSALTDYDESSVVDSKISIAINNLINGAGVALDTLNELAAALGNDPNFATTITNSLAGKQPLDGDLTAISSLSGTGFAVRTTTDTWQNRILTTPIDSGIAITNADGASGSPSFTNTDKGSTAVATHEGLSDPHPQYTTASELSSAISDFETTAQLNTRDTNNRSRSNHTGTQSVSTLSDFNTTIGTATQTALNAKYDASNPNGYETPAQLNSRDTANRSRANHTGTQLSSTISDFATSVLSVLLTGISFALATPVLATDSILTAIGKLQAQINALVFGLEYEYFEDTTPFSTNSATNQTAAQFTKTLTTGRAYRINMQWNFTLNTTTNSVFFGLYVDGVLVSTEIQIELKDQTDDSTYSIFTRYLPTTTGSKTIELRTRMENGSTVTVSIVKCDAWRVE